MNNKVVFSFVAYIIAEDKENYHEKHRLQNRYSVFQAELCAIKFAIKYIKENSLLSANIFTDSLSSLHAINNNNSSLRIENDIQKHLIELDHIGIKIQT